MHRNSFTFTCLKKTARSYKYFESINTHSMFEVLKVVLMNTHTFWELSRVDR